MKLSLPLAIAHPGYKENILKKETLIGNDISMGGERCTDCSKLFCVSSGHSSELRPGSKLVLICLFVCHKSLFET